MLVRLDRLAEAQQSGNLGLAMWERLTGGRPSQPAVRSLRILANAARGTGRPCDARGCTERADALQQALRERATGQAQGSHHHR